MENKNGKISSSVKILNKLQPLIDKTKRGLEFINEEDFVFLRQTNIEFLLDLSKILDVCQNNSEIEETLFTYKTNLLENALLSLCLFISIENSNPQVEQKVFENLLKESEYTVRLIVLIMTRIYNTSTDNKFFIPSREKMLNVFFKLPDILSNILKYSFIDSKLFFSNLFKSFIDHKLFTKEIIEKICKLKLASKLIDVIKISHFDNFEYILEIQEIFINTIFYDDYIELLFTTKVKTDLEFSNVINLFKYLDFGSTSIKDYLRKKLLKITHININFASLVLHSKNKSLINLYVLSILDILKSPENRIDQIDTFTFLTILFTFYHFINKIQGKETLFKILESILKMQGNFLNQLIDDKMKKIFYTFGNFIGGKISTVINLDGNEKLVNKEEFSINLSEEEKEIFNFEKIENNLMSKQSGFLYFTKLKEEYETKILKIKKQKESKESVSSVISENKKSKLISVKFKKKYGEFNEKKNSLLEFEFKKEPEMLLKISNNQKLPSLKIKLEKEDNNNLDLNNIATPVYLKDCMLGLMSEYPDRQKLSLDTLPEIILNQPLDLDFFLPQLSEVLLKLNNTFDLENFEEKVETSLIKLTVSDPIRMTQILCQRFFNEECGVKQKYQILTIIEKASEEISEYYTKIGKTPKINKLHCFFENIIFPLLNHLKNKNIEHLIVLPQFDYLLAKFLLVIAKLIKFSENHPFIYKALFESTELFKAIVNNKSLLVYKSVVLLDSLNFFSSVISKFLSSSFLEIYPEFFQNFKFMLNFLNNNFEKVEKKELKMEMIKNINNYLIHLEKFKEKYQSGLKSDLIII